MNAKILKQKRKQLGLTQDSLAEMLGVTRNTIINYENGGVIPEAKIVLLENVLYKNKVQYLTNEKNEKTEFTGYYLPEVSASAGLETSINNDELKKIPVTIPGWEKDIIFINVFGDSMYPKFNSGEVIGVKYVEFQYLNYGYPYVVVFNDGEVFIKIIQPGKDEEHLVLESVNAFYKPKEFHKSLIKSFYSIKGVIKKEMM